MSSLLYFESLLFCLGCEDCQTTYAGECPKHHLVPSADKVVLSRAWASLPATLQIFRLGNTTGMRN